MSVPGLRRSLLDLCRLLSIELYGQRLAGLVSIVFASYDRPGSLLFFFALCTGSVLVGILLLGKVEGILVRIVGTFGRLLKEDWQSSGAGTELTHLQVGALGLWCEYDVVEHKHFL